VGQPGSACDDKVKDKLFANKTQVSVVMRGLFIFSCFPNANILLAGDDFPKFLSEAGNDLKFLGFDKNP